MFNANLFNVSFYDARKNSYPMLSLTSLLVYTYVYVYVPTQTWTCAYDRFKDIALRTANNLIS